MRSNKKPLFGRQDLGTVIRDAEQRMYNEIDGIDGDSLLNTSVDDLCGYFQEKHEFAVPSLKQEEMSAAQREAKIDVSRDQGRVIYDRSHPFYVTGTGIDFYVPFQGDGSLFDCKPSTWTSVVPYATVHGNELMLRYESTDQNPVAARSFLDHTLSLIRQYLSWINADVSHFNQSLRTKARNRIEGRRQKLLADRNMMESLGIPMRRRDSALSTYTVPTSRRKPPISPPSGGAAPYSPDPTLGMKEYEHILSIIRNMTAVIERSPHAFREMGEEDLRQHFLVQLNGQYEGLATGETFNFKGKTDILIRWGGRNVFVAECKFWQGPRSLEKALDQLLGYLTWRDTKAALLLFNRNKDFSSVLEKVPGIIERHPNYKRRLPYEQEGSFRFVFGSPEDENREIVLTVLVFDMPA